MNWKKRKLFSRFFETNHKNLLKDNPLLKRIWKNFSIGFIGSVLLLPLSLGQTALLTKNLPIEDYGRILVVVNFFSFLAMLFGLRVNDFIYRFFPQFRERREYAEIKGILFISFALSLIVGLIVGLGTYIASSWVAQSFYNDLSYTALFRIYSLAAFFMAFEGFYTSILRLYDRFVFIVIPQVLGGGITLLLIIGYVLYFKSVTLEFVILARTAGILVTTLPPLFFTFFCTRKFFFKSSGFGLLVLKKYRKRIITNLFQTNLTGYLKLGSDTGGIFLLGLLASPTQVALYGLVRQLSQVLKLMQNNIQNAITPEIVSLWAKKNIDQLYALVNGYTRWFLIAGAIITFFAVLVSKPLILIFTTPEYLEAVPVFYVYIFSIYMTFVSLAFYPLTLAMDKLGQRNLVVSIRFIYLLIVVATRLNAMSLAIVQFGGIITVRIFNDMPLLKSLKKLALKG